MIVFENGAIFWWNQSDPSSMISRGWEMVFERKRAAGLRWTDHTHQVSSEAEVIPDNYKRLAKHIFTPQHYEENKDRFTQIPVAETRRYIVRGIFCSAL